MVCKIGKTCTRQRLNSSTRKKYMYTYIYIYYSRRTRFLRLLIGIDIDLSILSAAFDLCARVHDTCTTRIYNAFSSCPLTVLQAVIRVRCGGVYALSWAVTEEEEAITP